MTDQYHWHHQSTAHCCAEIQGHMGGRQGSYDGGREAGRRGTPEVLRGRASPAVRKRADTGCSQCKSQGGRGQQSLSTRILCFKQKLFFGIYHVMHT